MTAPSQNIDVAGPAIAGQRTVRGTNEGSSGGLGTGSNRRLALESGVILTTIRTHTVVCGSLFESTCDETRSLFWSLTDKNPYPKVTKWGTCRFVEHLALLDPQSGLPAQPNPTRPLAGIARPSPPR